MVQLGGHRVGNYQALAAIYRDGTGLPDQVPVNTMASMILEWCYARVLLIAILLLQLIASSRSVVARQGLVFCSNRGGLPGHDLHARPIATRASMKSR